MEIWVLKKIKPGIVPYEEVVGVYSSPEVAQEAIDLAIFQDKTLKQFAFQVENFYLDSITMECGVSHTLRTE